MSARTNGASGPAGTFGFSLEAARAFVLRCAARSFLAPPPRVAARLAMTRLAARLPNRRSLATKILVVGAVFAIVPGIVYERLHRADQEKAELLLKAAREQGRLIATYLEPTLDAGLSGLPQLGQALDPLSSENLNIRVLFRPETGAGNSGFYYVAASPPQSASYLESELRTLAGLGVLSRLSTSCNRNETVGIRHAVEGGPEQLITVVTPVANASGCWPVLTSYAKAEFLGSSVGRPYWRAPEIQLASALYFGAAVFTITVLLRIRRSLRAFRNTAVAIGRRGSRESFARQNRNPDLDGVAHEFDRMVQRIGLLSFSVDRSPIAVAIADRDWRLEYVNPAYERLAWEGKDRLLGRDLREAEFDSLSDECWDDICRQVARGETWQGELQKRRPDGSVQWAEVSLYCLASDSGGAERFVCIHEDISERKRILQDLVTARDRAESLNRMKTNFVARMSHEFRTPLNAILGFSEVIEQRMFGHRIEPKYVEYARHIHSSGTHLLSLINDVLDLSKLESGKETIHPEPVDLSTVIAETITLVEHDAAKARVRLEVDDRLSGRTVMADRRAIKQVLLNLLSNGIRYTPQGGQVRVAVAEREEGGISLVVADTGCGIEDADIARVCEPYERAGTAYVRTTDGTGLGLPIVKRLVELHDGEFRITSAIGKGTTVAIALPALERRSAA